MSDETEAAQKAKSEAMAGGPWARPSDMIPKHVNVKLPRQTVWHLLLLGEADALAADLGAAIASAAGRPPFVNGWNVEAGESAAATSYRKERDALKVKLAEVEAERDALERIVRRWGGGT